MMTSCRCDVMCPIYSCRLLSAYQVVLFTAAFDLVQTPESALTMTLDITTLWVSPQLNATITRESTQSHKMKVMQFGIICQATFTVYSSQKKLRIICQLLLQSSLVIHSRVDVLWKLETARQSHHSVSLTTSLSQSYSTWRQTQSQHKSPLHGTPYGRPSVYTQTTGCK